jgi:predicted nucleic acid-binding Zn ribbon protein
MTEKKETLCKWKCEAYAERFDKLRKIVAEPKYVCLKCGRVAERKKYLCRPEPLA